jgi:hypothetical protein
MDFSTILVIFLVLGTIGLLGWVELRSRRNQRALAEAAQAEAKRAEELGRQ